MGLWPGNDYFGYRYDYATEYVQVMKDLWQDGTSNFKGKHFTMDDCKLAPQPSQPIKIVAAGQSGRGVEFASNFADYNFAMGSGINTPKAYGDASARLVEAATQTGRDVGTYVLFMIIAEETDEEAQRKWKLYNDGIDVEALSWMKGQGSQDKKADANATATKLVEGTVNLSMGTLVGSFEKVAAMLDEAASVDGTKGLMLTFDDFVEGLEKFGQKVQPLMKSREGKSTFS